jgi:hypothetical protein
MLASGLGFGSSRHRLCYSTISTTPNVRFFANTPFCLHIRIAPQLFVPFVLFRCDISPVLLEEKFETHVC